MRALSSYSYLYLPVHRATGVARALLWRYYSVRPTTALPGEKCCYDKKRNKTQQL